MNGGPCPEDLTTTLKSKETGEQGGVIMKTSRKGVDHVLSGRVNLLWGKMVLGPEETPWTSH